MACFNAAILEIWDLDESMAIAAIKWGLCSFKFTYSLDKMLLRTYIELFEHAQKYIQVEEGEND